MIKDLGCRCCVCVCVCGEYYVFNVKTKIIIIIIIRIIVKRPNGRWLVGWLATSRRFYCPLPTHHRDYRDHRIVKDQGWTKWSLAETWPFSITDSDSATYWPSNSQISYRWLTTTTTTTLNTDWLTDWLSEVAEQKSVDSIGLTKKLSIVRKCMQKIRRQYIQSSMQTIRLVASVQTYGQTEFNRAIYIYILERTLGKKSLVASLDLSSMKERQWSKSRLNEI